MMNSVQVMVEHQVPGQFETKELDVCVFPPRSFDIRFMWQIRKQKNIQECTKYHPSIKTGALKNPVLKTYIALQMMLTDISARVRLSSR